MYWNDFHLCVIYLVFNLEVGEVGSNHLVRGWTSGPEWYCFGESKQTYCVSSGREVAG